MSDAASYRNPFERSTGSTKRHLMGFLSWNLGSETVLPHTEHPKEISIGDECILFPDALPVDEVGGWNETMAFFRYLWRCKTHFAMARYGDGELAVMSGRRYASETDIGNWTIDPNVNDASFMTLVQLMAEGFRLAAEHSMKKRRGGMFIGLPFHFCAEGMHDFRRGGGGHDDWLTEYLTRFSHLLHGVDQHRLVYSWQWGHFNYPSSMEWIHEMGNNPSGLILVCNEEVIKNVHNLPFWAKTVLTVPANGVEWILSDLDRVARQAARISRAYQNQIFIFSAGPISNALIPLMWKENQNNTYIDFGGTLDYIVHGIKTRPFHPDSASHSRPWLRADGSLVRDQSCHQTRYGVYYEPRVIPLDFNQESSEYNS